MSVPDGDSASLDGRLFGEAVAKRTASEMTAAATNDQLRGIGERGVAEVIARANAFISAGCDRAIVVAWLESAAEAFHSELAKAVQTLVSAGPTDTKQ